jgi:hypothetical protein
MAQIVEPDVRQSRLADEAVKGERERAGVPRRPIAVVKHVAGRPEVAGPEFEMPLALREPMLPECTHDELPEGQGARLRCMVSRASSKSTSDHRSPSSSPRRYPAPSATMIGTLRSAVGCERGELGEPLGADDARFMAFDLRRVHGVDRVTCDEIPLHRLP